MRTAEYVIVFLQKKSVFILEIKIMNILLFIYLIKIKCGVIFEI